MNKYNAYMENIKKSKVIALDIIEETKDVIETDVSPKYNKVKLKETPVSDEFNAPCTSKDVQRKPKEYVKYGKITFNTTAILHHYPQMQNKDCTDRNVLHKTATKKADLNVKEDKHTDNNNGVKNIETAIIVEIDRDSDNNNDSGNITSVESKDESKTPVKFAEEKLV